MIAMRRGGGLAGGGARVGTVTVATNTSGVLLAVALDEFFQVFAGGGDVLPEGVGGDVGIFGAAGVQEFVVGLSGHVQFAGENQM